MSSKGLREGRDGEQGRDGITDQSSTGTQSRAAEASQLQRKLQDGRGAPRRVTPRSRQIIDLKND